MSEQPTPREAMAEGMASHNRPSGHWESELPSWLASADAALAALTAAGYTVCREQVGWFGYTHSDRPEPVDEDDDYPETEDAEFFAEMNAGLDYVDFELLDDGASITRMNSRLWAWYSRPVFVPVVSEAQQ